MTSNNLTTVNPNQGGEQGDISQSFKTSKTKHLLHAEQLWQEASCLPYDQQHGFGRKHQGKTSSLQKQILCSTSQWGLQYQPGNTLYLEKSQTQMAVFGSAAGKDLSAMQIWLQWIQQVGFQAHFPQLPQNQML